MSFFRRNAPVTLEDELADLADRQPRPERDNWSRFRKPAPVAPVAEHTAPPVTLDDRRAQIRGAMTGASDTEKMHLAVHALRQLAPATLHHLVREMDRQIWKAMKP